MILNSVKSSETILEIGKGSGFLSDYLKGKGYCIETIDIDPSKKPDIVADIVYYDFQKEYDHLASFEVFEHISFKDFETVLEKLQRICRKYLFLSIPRNEKVWLKVTVELPGDKRIELKLVTKRNKIISKHHQWELDYKNYTKRRVESLFVQKGFEIVNLKKVHSLFFYQLRRK